MGGSVSWSVFRDLIRRDSSTNGSVELIELDYQFNDVEFAEAAAGKLLALLRQDQRALANGYPLCHHVAPRKASRTVQ